MNTPIPINGTRSSELAPQGLHSLVAATIFALLGMAIGIGCWYVIASRPFRWLVVAALAIGLIAAFYLGIQRYSSAPATKAPSATAVAATP
jgi:hypothetical protein